MKEVKEGSDGKAELATALETAIGPFTELELLERRVATVGRRSATAPFWRSRLPRSVSCLHRLCLPQHAEPMLYGICAIVAMLHDVCVVLGVFSILGVLLDVQIDALFVTALLTVIGFSRPRHDRRVRPIRENLAAQSGPDIRRRSSTTAWRRRSCVRSTRR